MKFRFVLLAILFLAAELASAQTISGTAVNATTNKPAAGDQVELLSLSQGMSVTGQSKTDAEGKFSFAIKDPESPHLVRVTHGGVSYFPAGGPINPGTSSVEVMVYDAAKKVVGITTNVDVIRLQSDGNGMQVVELIAVKNGSTPPHTLNSDRTYEFYLPPGAKVEQSTASSPGGMPISSAPIPAGENNKYAFTFPLKPGETRFQMAYTLPYSGEASFAPKINSELLHFVVMMPKSMKFEAKNAEAYKPLENDPQSTVEVASSVKPGDDLTFKVSGTGTLVEDQPGTGASGADASAPAADNRPGGGLGPPVESPDPLHQYRWAILAGLAAVMVAGGVFVVNRGGQQAAQPQHAEPEVSIPAQAQPRNNISSQSHESVLLAALKEELFQLELDRQKGKLSSEDYEKAKSGLDQTLQRVLSRSAQS